MAKPSRAGELLWLLICEKGADFPAHLKGVRGRYQLPDGTVRWLVEDETDLEALLRGTPGVLSIEMVKR